MEDPGFNSVEEIKTAAQSLSEFADDAIYGRLFEITFAESNLFFGDDERAACFAAEIEPGLRGKPDLENTLVTLPDEVQERLFSIIQDTRRAFLTIGLFLGARLADPSGKALDRLAKAWITATLAMPRYEHLRNSGGAPTGKNGKFRGAHKRKKKAEPAAAG